MSGTYRVLRSYFKYYHRSRCHLSLDGDAPESRPVQRPELGQVVELARSRWPSSSLREGGRVIYVRIGFSITTGTEKLGDARIERLGDHESLRQINVHAICRGIRYRC